jgi:hypothetical protein
LHERRISVRPQLPQRFAHDLPELVVGDFHVTFELIAHEIHAKTRKVF